MKEHWDEIYAVLDVDELTWYEEIPEMAKARKISVPCKKRPDQNLFID